MTETPKDVLKFAKDNGTQIVDFRFTDLPGLTQHFSVPVDELTEAGFEEGYGFDGSSIRGFQQIQESDMLLFPDATTAVMDPFRQHPTLLLNCFVKDPITGEDYSRDPRQIAEEMEEREHERCQRAKPARRADAGRQPLERKSRDERG